MESTNTSDRRSPEREAMDGDVVVDFADLRLVGPGQNISPEGVFFIADGSLPVKVTVEGRDEPVEGEVVRVETMGDGRVGIAVRFNS